MLGFSDKRDVIHKMDCLHRFWITRKAEEDAEVTRILVTAGSSYHPKAWGRKKEEMGFQDLGP